MAVIEGAPGDVAESEEPGEDDVSEAVEQAWERHREQARTTVDALSREDRCIEAEELADGFAAAVRFVDSLRVASIRHTRPAQVVLDRRGDRLHLALITKSHPRSVISSMDGIGREGERNLVIVVRELAHAFPPTWKRSIAKRDALLKMPNVHWLDLEREDAVLLLALRALVADARSRDVADLQGRPLDEGSVWAWIRDTLDVPGWTTMRVLQEIRAKGASPDRPSKPTPSASDPGEEARRPVAPPRSVPRPRPGSVGAGAMDVLLRLRVASVDRILREVSRIHPGATRADVLSDLQAARPTVRFYGRTLVAWREDDR